MIVAFYFRVGPTGGPHELVTVAPRRYPITGAARVEADRGDRVPADLEPCGIEHACNLCETRTLEATPDYQGDDWLDQFSRLQREQQPVEAWWPSYELSVLDRRDGPGAGVELVERIGHVELCPACHQRHGDVEDWPDELLDRVYGPEDGPVRCYPDMAASA